MSPAPIRRPTSTNWRYGSWVYPRKALWRWWVRPRACARLLAWDFPRSWCRRHTPHPKISPRRWRCGGTTTAPNPCWRPIANACTAAGGCRASGLLPNLPTSAGRGSAVTQHLDDSAEVLVGVIGGELRIDLGGMAAQRGGRSRRRDGIHRQPQVLVHQRRREPRFEVVVGRRRRNRTRHRAVRVHRPAVAGGTGDHVEQRLGR